MSDQIKTAMHRHQEQAFAFAASGDEKTGDLLRYLPRERWPLQVREMPQQQQPQAARPDRTHGLAADARPRPGG